MPLIAVCSSLLCAQNGVDRVCSAALRHGAKVSVACGSVVSYSGTAIVNAANEGCLHGGGVDGAVNHAGGEELIAAREALPLIAPRVRCHTGECKVTVAGDLSCKWVLHAVGPNYHMLEEEEGDRLLFSAYRAAMVEAKRLRMADVAFSLLSAGIFRAGKPLSDVLAIGALAVSACEYEGLEEVFLVGFTQAEVSTLTSLLEELHHTDADRAAEATKTALSRVAPSVRRMHADCLAGITEELPVGFKIAWMAAAANSEPVAVVPSEAIDMSD